MILWILVVNCDTPFQCMRISESVADHLSLFLSSSGCSYVNVAQLMALSHANYNNIIAIIYAIRLITYFNKRHQSGRNSLISAISPTGTLRCGRGALLWNVRPQIAMHRGTAWLQGSKKSVTRMKHRHFFIASDV